MSSAELGSVRLDPGASSQLWVPWTDVKARNEATLDVIALQYIFIPINIMRSLPKGPRANLAAI